MAKFERGTRKTYSVKKPGNGVYVFVIEGEAKVAGQTLQRRDGLGVWEADAFEVEALADAEILLMDVPMAP